MAFGTRQWRNTKFRRLVKKVSYVRIFTPALVEHECGSGRGVGRCNVRRVKRFLFVCAVTPCCLITWCHVTQITVLRTSNLQDLCPVGFES
jgi:hypothetical protein